MSTIQMKITGCTNKKFYKAFSVDSYMAMINPESIKWQRNIEYNQQQSVRSISASQKYKSTPSDELSFDIVIDCTRVVDAKRVDMAKEIGDLEKIIFEYNGKIHRPNYVKIKWGKNITFKSVLKNMDTSYTLFKSNASPLRAKVALFFGQCIAPSEVEKKDKTEPLDMSHMVDVVQGDTLPKLYDRIWNDDSYYIQVAEYNKLHKFRHLVGGNKLVFPPIIQPTS